jgi:hypothetical protein
LSWAVSDTIEINPTVIRYRVSPISDLTGIVDGDWDLERRHELAETVKYRAIRDHFVSGVPWQETELFTDIYRRRLRTGHVRGETTFEGLVRQYDTRVDGLAKALKRDGFKTHNDRGRPYPLPGFYVGRDGDLFIGNQGNHRLAISQVLGLDKIAGRIVCKHPLSPR